MKYRYIIVGSLVSIGILLVLFILSLPAPYVRRPLAGFDEVDWHFWMSPTIQAIAVWTVVVLSAVVAMVVRSLLRSLVRKMTVIFSGQKPPRAQHAS